MVQLPPVCFGPPVPVLNAPPAAPGVAPAIVEGLVPKAALPPNIGEGVGVAAEAKSSVGLDDAALHPKSNAEPVVAVSCAVG